MAKTNIGWTDDSWNPLRYRLIEDNVRSGAPVVPAGKWGYHCEKISPGCANCYAESINLRTLPGMGTGLKFVPLNTPKVEAYIDDETFDAPLRWKRPRMVFPFSMTDLFGAWVPRALQLKLIGRMHEATAHTFQVLTKRPEIAVQVMEWYKRATGTVPPNIWIGTSVENQLMAEQRMPWLIVCPAAKRFVSYEPALELVDFKKWLPYIHWLIIGGESGTSARPFDIYWAEVTIADCAAAGVPLFVKQLGARPSYRNHGDDKPKHLFNGLQPLMCNGERFKDRKGSDLSEWPQRLRVQQMPEGFAIKPKVKK